MSLEASAQAGLPVLRQGGPGRPLPVLCLMPFGLYLTMDSLVSSELGIRTGLPLFLTRGKFLLPEMAPFIQVPSGRRTSRTPTPDRTIPPIIHFPKTLIRRPVGPPRLLARVDQRVVSWCNTRPAKQTGPARNGMCRWPLVVLSTERDCFPQVLEHRGGRLGRLLRLRRKARGMIGCELMFFPTGALASPPMLRSQTWIGISG